MVKIKILDTLLSAIAALVGAAKAIIKCITYVNKIKKRSVIDTA